MHHACEGRKGLLSILHDNSSVRTRPFKSLPHMRQPKWRITSRTLSKAEKAMSVYEDDDDDDDDDDFDHDADRFPNKKHLKYSK